MPDARQIADMFKAVGLPALSLGIVREMSEPARTGVDVAVGVALGSVAVWVPAPIETKQLFGPSLTSRMVSPIPGNAVEVLAESVTLMGFVLALPLKGKIIICYSALILFSTFLQEIRKERQRLSRAWVPAV